MYKKNLNQLINNIIGQLNGINKMLEDERDCVEVITQLKAVKSACSSLMDRYISESTQTCLAELSSEDKDLLSKLIKELSSK